MNCQTAKRLTPMLFTLICWTGMLQAQLPGLPHPSAGDLAVGLAAGDQSGAFLAEGGDYQLLLWADERSNPYVYYEYETSSDIYALRLDQNGTAQETIPFAVTAERGSQSSPKAAWNGSHWLVVYAATSLSGTGYYYQSGLAAVRVDPNGTVIDPDPIPLYGLSSGTSMNWSVASDGDQWVVVTQGNDIGSDIVAVRISADGRLLDPPTRALVKGTYYGRSNIRLAHANGMFLLTYDEQGQTGAVLFDSALNPLYPEPFILLGHALSDLTSNDTELYIAWEVQKADFTLAVFGSRVSATGSLLDGSGVEISGAFPPQTFNGRIAAAWDGFNWRVSWPNGGVTRVATVNTAGAVLDPGGAAVSGITAGDTAGTGSGGLHFTWADFSDNEYDVFAATIDASAGVLANGGASTSTPRQYRADLAAGSSGYLLVYRSALAGLVRILAQPLDAAGVPTTAEPLELDQGSNLSGPGSPAVAWNGSVYLVSWGAPGGIMAQRIAPDGTAVDPAPFLVMNPGFGAVDVAALGSDFLVAGFRFGYTTQIILPFGARVGGDGTVLDASALSLGDYYTQYSRDLAVTALDDRWLVAWHNNVSHDNPLATTRARFVAADGALSEAIEVHGPFSTSGGNSIFNLALASDGTRSLMVQSQELTSGVETDLLAHVINGDGTVEPMVNLTPWSGNQYRPQLSFDGRDYVLVYQDQKNRLAPWTLDQLDARSDIYGMRITPGGAVIDPQGFLVADSSIGETDPNLASRGGDTLILASQMRNDGVHSAYRVQLSDVLDGANRFPVAVANASIRQGDAPLTVNFDSAGSYDPEGGPISYLWQFGDGASSALASPSHEYGQPGEYLALLTVYDDQLQVSSQGITIKATPVNLLPIANASANRYSGTVPLSVELYADGSYDPDGHLGNTEWREGGVLVSYNPTAYYSTSVEGVHTLTLRVYDSRGAFGEDEVIITATPASENLPPTAVASATPTSGLAPLGVAFSSAGSGDADGSIVSWEWDFGDGGSGSGANPGHQYNSTGSYTATLTVTDNTGDSDSASVPISVTGLSASALVGVIDMSTYTKRRVRNARAVVTVTNGIGGAEQSAIVQGRWTFPDGSTLTRYEYSDRDGEATFDTPAGLDGVYGFEIFTVTKSGFAWASGDSETSDAITIGDPGGNEAPTASFTYSCTGLSCDFDGASSTDPDGSITAYAWDFGDGASGSGATSTHSYASAATYTVTLTVTDNEGATDGDSQSVTVTAEPPVTVDAHVGDLDGGASPGSRSRWDATVTVVVHDADEAPVNGATVSGAWSNGANGSGSCVTGPSGQCAVSKSNLKSNVSQVTFSVSDISGAGISYLPSANHDPDGDSDGTAITVNQP
jgi:PKD repeat protein